MLFVLVAPAGALAAEFVDGVYLGTGAGMHSNIDVEVVVRDGRLVSIDILAADETPGIADGALAQIPAAMVERQAVDVDAVAGATLTSRGIIAAVHNALEPKADEAVPLDIVPDFIVVGGGMSGLVAAVRAAELNVKTLLIEESVRLGGCIQYAGGTVVGADYKLQREAGTSDTAEAFYEDILRLGDVSQLNPDLARTFAERSGAAVDWLDEYLHVDFGDRTLVEGAYTPMATARITRALGSYAMYSAQEYLNKLIGKLDEAIAAGHVQVMLNNTVTELVVEDDICLGVRANDALYSAPTVLLATGGYCYDEALLKSAGFENVISQAPKTSNGSGYYLAQAVGGVFDNMDKLVNYYGGGVPTNGFDMSYVANTSHPGRIYVDVNGDRVGDELTGGIALWKNAPENKLFVIVSESVVEPDVPFLRDGMANLVKMQDGGWAKFDELAGAGNCAYKADTIEELAEALDAPGLVATLERYNADAAAGADTAFGRDPESMIPLDEGPYYALLTVPYVWSGSTGGVRVNGEAQLVKADGTAIEGLYLAGEILGPTNISGNIIFGGINHGMCATFGLLAAEHAAGRVAYPES